MGVQNTCHMIREPKPLYGFSIDFLLKFVIVSGGGGILLECLGGDVSLGAWNP